MGDKVYTTQQAAVRLGYRGDSTIRKLLERKQITGIKFGHVWLITESAIVDYVTTRGKHENLSQNKLATHKK